MLLFWWSPSFTWQNGEFCWNNILIAAHISVMCLVWQSHQLKLFVFSGCARSQNCYLLSLLNSLFNLLWNTSQFKYRTCLSLSGSGTVSASFNEQFLVVLQLVSLVTLWVFFKKLSSVGCNFLLSTTTLFPLFHFIRYFQSFYEIPFLQERTFQTCQLLRASQPFKLHKI